MKCNLFYSIQVIEMRNVDRCEEYMLALEFKNPVRRNDDETFKMPKIVIIVIIIIEI